MRGLALPILALLILAYVPIAEAKTCYVRFDGSDQYCIGLQDVERQYLGGWCHLHRYVQSDRQMGEYGPDSSDEDHRCDP